MDRIINIALVGHVANGKTTLVNALTGVNTKRSSSEQKTGRTIKLGYANCVLWQCEKCLEIYSSGQSEKTPECCSTTMKRKCIVSFVDAPGHHSYIHTMVKGATVVDIAILVTDVRREPMQTQTTEHLAILSILDVRNIIVVQNKADLISPDKCLEHYTLLREELRGTAAEDSIIIPVSAISGINIGILRKALLDMCIVMQSQPISKKGVFQIIRSFDVNKPGDDIEKLKGGVLGGTVVGNARYSIGDLVEIRPGLVSNNNKYQPLQTQILSIFAETEPKTETTIGGLYGVGTKLDPSLTMADRLSGSLLGKPEELPEVINKIEMYVTIVNLGEMKERVKPNKHYKLIIGNVVVEVISKESSSPKSIIMELMRPICTIETKCLIYNIESSKTQLIAFGSFSITAQKNDISNAKVHRQKIEQPVYTDLIKDLKIHEKAIVKIPIVKLARENRNMIWYNVEAFASAIYRNQTEVAQYLAAETLLEISACATGLRIYKTNINSAKIESIMKKYIKEFVVCKQCNSLQTNAKECLSCGACVRDLRT